MNVLITGASGFIGKNLVATLENIRDGKDTVHKLNACTSPDDLHILQFDKDNTLEELNEYCRVADFVFNLAGVNRTESHEEFIYGNVGFASHLLDTLKRNNNTCTVMLSSSIQASLQGRFENSSYGKSKKACEELFNNYSIATGAKILIYRFPNLFGKWCRPNYNSAVATFCHNIAHNLPIQVNDRNTQLELVYIDDLLEEMLLALNGEEHYTDGFCYVPTTFQVTLGNIVDLLEEFKTTRELRTVPDLSDGFTYRLFSTFISYLPTDNFAYPLKMNVDSRGSFTEILRTNNNGQFSVNIIKPGVIRGNHWHHTKLEKFVVVSGKGLIQLRRIGVESDGQPFPVIEYHVNGEEITVVDIPPGYTHNIINEGEADMITFMWSNECFNPDRPDTYYLNV